MNEVHGTARLSHGRKLLTMTVKGKRTVYVVENLHPTESVANPAYRLTKEDGKTYDVAMTDHGPVCDCADSQFRSRCCKHILGAITVKLLPKAK